MTQLVDLMQPLELDTIFVAQNEDWLYINFGTERWDLTVNLPRAQAKELAAALRTNSWTARVHDNRTSALQGGGAPQLLCAIKLRLGWFALPERFARVVERDPRVTRFSTSALRTPLSVRGGAVVALDLVDEPLATISDWQKVVEIAQSLELVEEQLDACIKAQSMTTVQVDTYGLPWARQREKGGFARTMKIAGFGDATPTEIGTRIGRSRMHLRKYLNSRVLPRSSATRVIQTPIRSQSHQCVNRFLPDGFSALPFVDFLEQHLRHVDNL